MQEIIKLYYTTTDEDAHVDAMAQLLALIEDCGPDVRQTLIDAFEAGTSKQRALLLQLFGASQHPDFEWLIKDTIQYEQDKRVRAYAISACMGYPGLIETVRLARLEDKSKRVRMAAEVVAEYLQGMN